MPNRKEIIAAAKQDLDLLGSYRNEIKNLRDRAAEYREMSRSLQRELSVSKSPSHRAGNSKMEHALDLLEQIPDDIESIAQKYQQQALHTLRILKSMESHIYRQVLEYRHINLYSSNKIAITMCYSVDRIHHIISDAYISYWETKEKIEQAQ